MDIITAKSSLFSKKLKNSPCKKIRMSSTYSLLKYKNKSPSADINTNETNAEDLQKEKKGTAKDSDEKILNLEKRLKESEEKYELDINNMQEYINLLRKKINNNQNLTVDEQVKKEKEKTLIFYKALKAKEKECLECHKSNSINSFKNKIHLLMLDKNRLEESLYETENDMKRLYKEIKYQNEIIASYKEKATETQENE